MEIVLDHPGLSLGKTCERLVVREEGRTLGEFAAADVAGVAVTSLGVSVSADAIALSVEHAVPVCFIDRFGEPIALVAPAQHLGNARIRIAQVRAAAGPVGIGLARSFTTGKLRNQESLLKYLGKSRLDATPERERIDRAIPVIQAELARLPGIDGPDIAAARGPLLAAEGRAAQAYWGAVGAVLPERLGFPGRVRRGATDPFNSSLNYGYGILYTRLWGLLLRAGLDPYVGFLHAPRDHEPALVFDFIEEYRQALVDRPLIGWVNRGGAPALEDGRLDRPTRAAVIKSVLERLDVEVRYGGGRATWHRIIESEAREIVATVLGQEQHEAHVADW